MAIKSAQTELQIISITLWAKYLVVEYRPYVCVLILCLFLVLVLYRDIDRDSGVKVDYLDTKDKIGIA